MPFDRDSWERRWAQVLRDHPEMVASRPPNARFVAEFESHAPGNALDAGCGHGAETMWLAARGWRVTAVDFSAAALAHAMSTAVALGDDVADRIQWFEVDLGDWEPPTRHFDLVSCLHVHVAGSMREFVRRLGSGVAPGGTLFIVGHLGVDPATGAPTRAADQVQVTVDGAVDALDAGEWRIVTAEEHARADGDGADAVIRAERR